MRLTVPGPGELADAIASSGLRYDTIVDAAVDAMVKVRDWVREPPGVTPELQTGPGFELDPAGVDLNASARSFLLVRDGEGDRRFALTARWSESVRAIEVVEVVHVPLEENAVISWRVDLARLTRVVDEGSARAVVAAAIRAVRRRKRSFLAVGKEWTMRGAWTKGPALGARAVADGLAVTLEVDRVMRFPDLAITDMRARRV